MVHMDLTRFRSDLTQLSMKPRTVHETVMSQSHAPVHARVMCHVPDVQNADPTGAVQKPMFVAPRDDQGSTHGGSLGHPIVPESSSRSPGRRLCLIQPCGDAEFSMKSSESRRRILDKSVLGPWKSVEDS